MPAGSKAASRITWNLFFCIGAIALENCTECDRLWQDYANATIEQFRLQGKLRVASLELRRAEIQGFTLSVEASIAAIERVREAMQSHESTHGAVQPGLPESIAVRVLDAKASRRPLGRVG